MYFNCKIFCKSQYILREIKDNSYLNLERQRTKFSLKFNLINFQQTLEKFRIYTDL